MLDLAGGLQDQNIRVTLLCPARSPLTQRAQAAGIQTAPTPRGGLLSLLGLRWLCQFVRKEAVDIVHAHNGRSALLAGVAARITGRCKAVATQHFISPAHTTRRGPGAIVSRWIHHWVSAATAHFIAISKAVHDEMVKRKDVAAEKITVVLNGINDPLGGSLSPGESVRASLGIDPSTPLIVCASRLEPEKDVPTLIEAMKEVQTHFPQAIYVHAGEGSQFQRCLRMIEEARLSPIVRMLGFCTDTLSLINAADLFVLPAPAEPFGLVLLEAMALSKPVVATAAGGPLEIVRHGETGLLVPPSQPKLFAAAIQSLLADPVNRKQLGASGRSRFVECFKKERMSAEIAEVYRRLVGARESMATVEKTPVKCSSRIGIMPSETR